MCGSMETPTAEIRRGIKKEEERRKKQHENIYGRDHKKIALSPDKLLNLKRLMGSRGRRERTVVQDLGNVQG